MNQIINTNIPAQIARNNIRHSQSALGDAMKRLSSGLRINRAKDDAAGQAITNRFTANINGLAQGSRNANDAISLAQTTEGTLNEINDNLQNIRRLTVQAKNGTNSESDLRSIQSEINQHLVEINRIAEQTEFNGIKVLSRDRSLSIQTGAHDGQTIEVNLRELNTDKLGITDFTITGMVSETTGNSRQVLEYVECFPGTYYLDYILTEADFETYNKGVYFVIVGDNYRTVGVKEDGTFYELDVEGGKLIPSQRITAANDPKLHQDLVDTFFPDSLPEGPNPETAPQPDAGELLKTIDNAIAKVDSCRSALGAAQNRFDSVINNNTAYNLSASRSCILDTDYALAVANISRAQILQQAGTAVLVQANKTQQNVLSLLQ